MNPRLKKRTMMARPSRTRTLSTNSASESSSLLLEVRNEAALLLSLSDIVNREVQQTSGGLDGLWRDHDDDDDDSTRRRLPKLPRLGIAATVSQSYDDDDDEDDASDEHFHKKMKMENTTRCLGFLKPRCELLYPSYSTTSTPTTSTTTNLRLRSVSIDSPRLVSAQHHVAHHFRTASPISLSDIHPSTDAAATTPRGSPRSPRRRSGNNASAKKTGAAHLVTPAAPTRAVVGTAAAVVTCSPKKGQELQRPVVLPTMYNKKTIKTISRKKFSWKNYPELEAFLIDNRNDYLHHSALNYTIQQKQYNNKLTCELLELATEHGYLFNVQEFSFVTVRDRIRCYYKSYVQSAKKRGVLMGYAARKAGLLSTASLSPRVHKHLDKSNIITP